MVRIANGGERIMNIEQGVNLQFGRDLGNNLKIA
jgi:hypothetical protein